MNGIRMPYRDIRMVLFYDDEAFVVRHKCNPVNGPCPQKGIGARFTDEYDFDPRLEDIEDVLMLVVGSKSR